MFSKLYHLVHDYIHCTAYRSLSCMKHSSGTPYRVRQETKQASPRKCDAFSPKGLVKQSFRPFSILLLFSLDTPEFFFVPCLSLSLSLFSPSFAHMTRWRTVKRARMRPTSPFFSSLFFFTVPHPIGQLQDEGWFGGWGCGSAK